MNKQATQGTSVPLGGFMEAAQLYDQAIAMLDDSITATVAIIEQRPNHVQHHVMLHQLTEHRTALRASRDQCVARAAAQHKKHAAPSGTIGQEALC
jgi:hypothetical protein